MLIMELWYKLLDLHALDGKVNSDCILAQHTSLYRPDLFQTFKALAIDYICMLLLVSRARCFQVVCLHVYTTNNDILYLIDQASFKIFKTSYTSLTTVTKLLP